MYKTNCLCSILFWDKFLDLYKCIYGMSLQDRPERAIYNPAQRAAERRREMEARSRSKDSPESSRSKDSPESSQSRSKDSPESSQSPEAGGEND